MPFTSEQCTWALHRVNQQELSSIQVLSTSPSLVSSVMMRQLATINSRNTIPSQEVSFKETKCIKDVRPWHTTCTNLILIRYFQKHHPSLHMVQQNFKVSYGKIILAFNHSKKILTMQFNSNWNSKTINVPSSNS